MAEGAQTPKARGGHTAVLVEKNLLIMGGEQHKSSGVFEYFSLNPVVLDTEIHTWFEPRVALGKGPTPRAYHTTTRVGSALFIFGGSTAHVAGESGLLSDMPIFDLVRMAWETRDVRGTTPLARYMHSAAIYDAKLFVSGGTDGTRTLSDVNVLDTDTLLWSQPKCTGSVPPGLQAHSCTLVGDRLFYVGGLTIALDAAGHSSIAYSRDVYVSSACTAAMPGQPGDAPPALACPRHVHHAAPR